MTTREAAEQHGVSIRTIYKWIRSGKLKAEKRGRRWFIIEEDPSMEWPSYVHDTARQDGRTPEEFNFHQWPVSNVRIEQPPHTYPDDVALLYRCDMSPDTPVSGPGIALSSVRFRVLDELGVKLDEARALLDEGNVIGVLAGKSPLWTRIAPGSSLRVQLESCPLFYYIDEQGGVQLGYADMGERGYFRGTEVRSPVYTLAMNDDGALILDGKPRPEYVHVPTAEEIAEREESDRIMREEREAHERQEREIRERVARENREANERIEREKREAAEADRKVREAAEAERRRQREEQERMDREAAEERARLGIKDRPKPTAPRSPERQSIEDYYDSQLKGTLGDEGQDISDDLYRDFLVNRVKPIGGAMAAAANEILKEKGWS